MSADALTVDHVLLLQQLTNRVPLHVSPDGRSLAISVQRQQREAPMGEDQSFDEGGVPHEAEGSRVLVVDTTTGEVREPFPAGSTSWGAQWSPSGARLAAYIRHEGPPCLAVWDTDGTVRYFRDAIVRPFFGFEVPQWTPDGGSVVVKVIASGSSRRRDDGQPSGHDGPTVAVFSFDPTAPAPATELPGWADGYVCDLALVDLATGAVGRLVADWRLMGWAVAPGGGSVAVLRYTASDATRQQHYYDLSIVPLDGTPPRTIATRIPQLYGIAFSWSPDGARIAYLSAARHGGRTGLFVVPQDGDGPPVDLTAGEDLALRREYDAPRWHPDGRLIYCLSRRGVAEFAADGGVRRQIVVPAGREVIGWAQRPGESVCWLPTERTLPLLLRDVASRDLLLAHADLADDRVTVRARIPAHCSDLPFGLDVAPDGSGIYACLEATDHPEEIWRFGAGFEAPRRLLPLNPDLGDLALGTARLVKWRALDGERRRGLLLLPPGYAEGRPLPLLVEVYPGWMGSEMLHSFGGFASIVHAQVLAARGYAVLWPDMPAGARDPLRHLPGQVLPAIDRLIELGIADPNRLGVLGHSYGGYCAQALIAQTGRFKAAVASAGATNLTSIYGALGTNGESRWLGWLESGQGQAGGSLWERRDAYIENSPLFYLDRVVTPLLLITGGAHAEEPAQGGEAFSALRRLGKRVELRIYRGEGHAPILWSEANYRDVCERVLAWFDEHLGVSSAATGGQGTGSDRTT